ncbi:hypothetical protein SAMN05216223_116114 [Actinacidiphila yanglinensis]|uniref:Sigma-70 family RNA polymerase sigma factor n=1 Tax=Actinacidiphila yanglinensis TaxID=310779 RepID=A0A1H6DK76_9ACTN|nr:hypothetical protein [Actinacidiphila yanglinensis]SEG85662.1 hypothetical protein SAMN05216223_116114 [Actinacidiphila yanglinensis]
MNSYNNAIDRLRAEWPLLCADPLAGAAVTGWLIDAGVLAPGEVAGDLGAVLPELERRDARRGREHTDRWMGALLRQVGAGGQDGQLAARVVVQAMLPAATSTVYRMRWLGHDLDDVVQAVVASLYEVVLSYPLQRRPRRIAANLLMDTVCRARGELRADACDLSGDEPLDDDRLMIPDPGVGPDELAIRRQLAAAAAASGLPGLDGVDVEDLTGSRGRVVELLMWALERRVLVPGELAAICDHYREGAPRDEVAAQRAGVRPEGMRKRRSRAVRRLAAAAGRWAEQVA